MSKETMKAITVYGPRDARMETVPKPLATGDTQAAGNATDSDTNKYY